MASMKTLLARKGWSSFRARWWHAQSASPPAVGYRFDPTRGGSQPAKALDEELARQRDLKRALDLSKLPAQTEIETQFTDQAGGDCGKIMVEFVLGQNPLHRAAYLVNNSDISGLLRLISSCASN